MDEPMPMSDEQLGRALSTLGREIDYPGTPSMSPAVVARLTMERSAGRRPPLPGAALWSRRRVVVLVAVGVLAALALAAAARLAIGSIQIRVQPGVTPSASLPPVEPQVLGEPLSIEDAIAQAGFAPALPASPAPDEAYLVDSGFGEPGLLFAWRRSEAYPALPGTDHGMLLLALEEDAGFVVKTVDRFEDVHRASFAGRLAYWIPVPHVLSVSTQAGTQTYSVTGNVLIWQADDGITYRLETTLGRAEAIALAESFS
jgi:hypothetical protein